MSAALSPVAYRLPGSPHYVSLISDALLELARKAGMPEGPALQLESAVVDLCRCELKAAEALRPAGPAAEPVLTVLITPGSDRITVQIEGVRPDARTRDEPDHDDDTQLDEQVLRCLVDDLEAQSRKDGSRVLRLTKRF